MLRALPKCISQEMKSRAFRKKWAGDSCKYRNNRAKYEKNSRSQVADEHHTEDTCSHENVLRSDRKALLSRPCTARCGIPVSAPRTAASPSKCGHYVAPPVPRKGREPQRKPLREGEGARGTLKSPPRLRTRFLLFCVFTFSWGCHTESPANSLAGLLSALFGVPCPEVPMSRRMSGFEMSRGSMSQSH